MLCGCLSWHGIGGCRVALKHITPLSFEEGLGVRLSRGVLKHITPLSFGEGLGVRLLGLLGLLGLLLEQLLLIYKQHIFLGHRK